MFEKLNEQDRMNIYNYIKTYSGDHREPESRRASLEYLLRFWNDSKENLCKLFGGNLILEKEITIEEPVSCIEDRILAAIEDYDTDIGEFYNDFNDKVYNLVKYETYSAIRRMFRVEDLATNKYHGKTFNVEYNGKKVTVQEGCKPVKMLGKLVKLFGICEEEYEAFRLAQSLETNQKKLKGTLCLSIHPLDYMTMSDNDSDWESCMSWMNQGCYCRGTVEMMNSNCVIVAYLRNNEPMKIHGVDGIFEWNDKRWRQLFICNDEFMTSIKAYPYRNDELSFMVLDWLRELAKENWDIDYTENTIYEYSSTYEPFKDKEAKFHFYTHTMYNDFGTVDHHIMINKKYYELNDKLNFNCRYSGEEECMFCGSTYDSFDGEGTLICTDCDEGYYCDDCGERVYYDDMYEVDGSRICQYCYDNHTAEDPITEEVHLDNNMMNLWFINPEALEDKENIDFYSYPSIYIFEDHDSDTLKPYFNLKDGFFPYVSRTLWGNRYHYVTPDMLTDKTYELFNYCYDDTEDLIKDIYKN